MIFDAFDRPISSLHGWLIGWMTDGRLDMWEIKDSVSIAGPHVLDVDRAVFRLIASSRTCDRKRSTMWQPSTVHDR